MKAQVIKYSYIEHENDLDQGFRAWSKTKVAIYIPEVSVLVVEWNDKVHFFLMKSSDDKMMRDYYLHGHHNSDIKLPRAYEVIREIQVDDQMAKWAYAFVDSISYKIKRMNDKWKDELRQASAG